MRPTMLYLVVLLTSALSACAQQPNLYNPQADAQADVARAIADAQAQGKHVLLQVGGNWCPWCIKLHQFMESNADIKTYLSDNYIVVKVNYSKENKNLELLERLGNPQRFGFPVLVILDVQGQRLHTQDTGLLESGDGYDIKKVQSVLKGWSPEGCKQTGRR